MKDVFDRLKFQKGFLVYLGSVLNNDGADNVKLTIQLQN
jgi:hypothetical protein